MTSSNDQPDTRQFGGRPLTTRELAIAAAAWRQGAQTGIDRTAARFMGETLREAAVNPYQQAYIELLDTEMAADTATTSHHSP